MKKNQGFVMLIVLLFMQVSVLLSLYALESSTLEMKMGHAIFQRTVTISTLDTVLKTLESEIQTTLPNCMIPQTLSSRLVKQPLTWWQTQSCSGNFQAIRYYYVLEPLGVDRCAHIARTDNETADYYRLTLFGLSAENDDKVWIQVILIRPDGTSHTCEGTVHSVEIGRQSWNLLKDEKK